MFCCKTAFLTKNSALTESNLLGGGVRFFRPSPPPHWCEAADLLLRDLDAPLYHHLTQELGLHAGEDVTWPLVSTFLSQCFPLAQWAHVMDHLLGKPPMMLVCTATAMLQAVRMSLLAAISLQDIAALLRIPNSGINPSALLDGAARAYAHAARQRLRLRDDAPNLSFPSAQEFGGIALDASILDSLGKPQEHFEWLPVWRRAWPALRTRGSDRGQEYAPFHRYPARRVEEHFAGRRYREEGETWLWQSRRKDAALEEMQREFVLSRVAERNAFRADLRARLASQSEAEAMVRSQCREVHARHVESSQQRLDRAEALQTHARAEREMAVAETCGVVKRIARMCLLVCACMCACMCVCVCLCGSGSGCAYRWMCMHACMHLCAHSNTCTHNQNKRQQQPPNSASCHRRKSSGLTWRNSSSRACDRQ